MSCAELIYHQPQSLASGFPYPSQRSIADAYCSSYNSVTSAVCSDYNDQAEDDEDEATGHTRMLHSLGPQTSSSTLQSSDFVSSSSSPPSLGLPPPPPSLPPPLPPPPIPAPQAPLTPPPQNLRRGLVSGAGSGAVVPQALPLSLPCVGRSQHPQPRPQIFNAAITPSSLSSSSISPLLSSSSPSLSYFSPTSSSSSSSAFTARQSLGSSSDLFPPAPSSTIFLPPTPSSSLSPASSYASSLKRSSSEVEELDEVAMPKKTRYVTSNCVLLTYHERDTSSEVDEHFSRALSSPGSSASCGYGSAGSSRHSSTADSPPMSQRNFPPSFWDATHYLRQRHCSAAAVANYNYHHQAAAFGSHGSGAAGQTAGFFAGAAPHDPLYPLSSPFLPGSLGMPPPLHPSFSSLHKDPWASFPFSSGSKSAAALNYYRYPRAGAYPDPHTAFSSSYASPSAVNGGSGRFSSSNYSSLLLPSTSSSRGSAGHFPPSATITSAQSVGGELGARMTPLVGEHSRGVFAGSGSLSGLDSSAHEPGKDFHWY